MWSPANGTVVFASGNRAPESVRAQARPERGMGDGSTENEVGVPLATLIEVFADVV